MPRLTYWQIFRLVDDNTLEVLRKLKIGSIEFDSGALIRRGTLVAGLDLFKFFPLNAEVEGDEDGDTWVLRRIIFTSDGQ